MATKNIKKILLNKNGNNYVANIEDIENRITQNSSNLETAKQELSNKCNEALSQAKAYTDQEKLSYSIPQMVLSRVKTIIVMYPIAY